MGYSTACFVSAPPDFAICVICLDVLQEATEICDEAHTLCLGCSSKVKNCPSCRARVVSKNVRPAKTMQRIISALPSGCRYKRSGCNWVGAFSDRRAHRTKNCEYRPQDCPNMNRGCAFTGTTQQITAHLNVECLLVRIPCKRECGLSFKRADEEAHDNLCDQFECTVSNTCSTWTTRRNLVAHEKQCKTRNNKLDKSQKDLSKAQDDLKKAQSELRALKAAEKKRLAAEAAAEAAAQRVDNDEVKPAESAGAGVNAVTEMDGPRPRRSTRPSLKAREAGGLETPKPQVEALPLDGAVGRKRGRSESKENEEAIRDSPVKAAKLEA